MELQPCPVVYTVLSATHEASRREGSPTGPEEPEGWLGVSPETGRERMQGEALCVCVCVCVAGEGGIFLSHQCLMGRRAMSEA